MRTLSEANKLLAQYIIPIGSGKEVYTLERMVALMGKLEDPQNDYRVIHVAGTSGKTSTSYYLASLLKAAGKKVGLTISPHVAGVNERVQIGLEPLPEAMFCKELEVFVGLVKKTGVKPTYFELLVAFAYWYFAKQKVDYVVAEVGLGGLLDGTNVVTRADKICVITDIGLDHTHILGETIAQIVEQKLGIVATGNDVFKYFQNPEIDGSVQTVTQRRQGKLHFVKNVRLSSTTLPLYQQRNWQLAREVYESIAKRDQLSELSKQQLAQSQKIIIPARMEQFEVGDKTVVLDGAHNAQKMGVLHETIKEKFGNKPIAALLAVVKSKDFRKRTDLSKMANMADRIVLTTFSVQQDTKQKSENLKKVADACKELGATNITTVTDPEEAYDVLLEGSEPVCLVTGSFYLINIIRPIIMKSL